MRSKPIKLPGIAAILAAGALPSETPVDKQPVRRESLVRPASIIYPFPPALEALSSTPLAPVGDNDNNQDDNGGNIEVDEYAHLNEEERARKQLHSCFRFAKRYEVTTKLGRGTFGMVFKATSRADGAVFAVKVAMPQRNSRNLDSIRELRNLRRFRHRNVVKSELSYEVVFQGVKSIVLGFRLAEKGDLGRFVFTRAYNRGVVRAIFKQLVEGMDYIHSKGMIHGDFKAGNALVYDEVVCDDLGAPLVKISDLGAAQRIGDGGWVSNFNCTSATNCPEAWRNKDKSIPKILGKPGDMWSLGCTLYFMLRGKYPFDNDDDDVFEYDVRNGHYNWNIEMRHIEMHVSTAAKWLVNGLTLMCPTKRMTAQEVLDARWMHEEPWPSCEVGTTAPPPRDVMSMGLRWSKQCGALTTTAVPETLVQGPNSKAWAYVREPWPATGQTSSALPSYTHTPPGLYRHPHYNYPQILELSGNNPYYYHQPEAQRNGAPRLFANLMPAPREPPAPVQAPALAPAPFSNTWQVSDMTVFNGYSDNDWAPTVNIPQPAAPGAIPATAPRPRLRSIVSGSSTYQPAQSRIAAVEPRLQRNYAAALQRGMTEVEHESVDEPTDRKKFHLA